jgi:hypothetical protein
MLFDGVMEVKKRVEGLRDGARSKIHSVAEAEMGEDES